MADRVLIIDADPATGAAVSDAFKAAGARVQTISDGADAAAALLVFPADFVFLARNTGSEEVSTVCQTVRASSENPRLAICVVDADSETVGADFSLESPVIPEDAVLVCTELMADVDSLLQAQAAESGQAPVGGATEAEPDEVAEVIDAEIIEAAAAQDSPPPPPTAAAELVGETDSGEDTTASPSTDALDVDLTEVIDLEDGFELDPETNEYEVAPIDESLLTEVTSEIEELEAPAEANELRGRRREDSAMNTPANGNARELLQLRENLNRKEREVVDLKDELFKIQHREIEYIERIEVLEARLGNTEKDLAGLRSTHAETKATLEATAGSLAEAELKLTDTQDTLTNTAGTLENTEQTLVQTITELETANDNNERLTKELAEAQAETRSSAEAYEARIREIEKTLTTNHKREMSAAQRTFDERLAGENRRLTEEKQKLESELTARLEQSQAKVRELAARLDHAEGSARRWKTQYEELAVHTELRIAESDAKIAAADAYSTHARADIESLLGTLASAQDAVRKRDAALDKLQAALETAVEAVVSVEQVALPVPAVASAAPATKYDALTIETKVDLGGGARAEEADRASLAAVESGRAEFGQLEEVSFGEDFDEEFEELDDL